MARNTEQSMNYALARALCKRHPLWDEKTVHAEQTRVLLKDARKQPDILVEINNRQPVVIEAEVNPADDVEEEARGRLGAISSSTTARIESALAVIYPERFRDGDKNLDEAIENANDLRYATFHELDDSGNKRWPEPDSDLEWIETDVNGLADAIEDLSLSERMLARGTSTLEDLVRDTANLLKTAGKNPLKQIAKKLHQEAGEQTNRMAAAIFVSAFMFHGAIEKQEQNGEVVPGLPNHDQINMLGLMDIWNEILGINYEPIFNIACELLDCLPDTAVKKTMKHVREGISALTDLGVATYHDLAGQMFQKLIADRKFLATFYTPPASARLLAELAVRRLNVDWSDADAIKELKIADFACGTGALLSAAQQAVYSRHRRAGEDDANLHTAMMENILIGMDIMPATAHLTCSMLSSAHPLVSYDDSQIHTITYGARSKTVSGMTDKTISIGSLDLLNPKSIYMFDTGVTTMRGRGGGEKLNKFLAPPNGSCDLIVMNPPFIRPVGQESSKIGVPVPSFAGFETSKDEQRKMSAILKSHYKKIKNGAGDGKAGLASNFIDLAHIKLKNDGVLALVLPFTFIQGPAWKKARQLIYDGYRDVRILSIAAAKTNQGRAFSADTNMADCLVVATKGKSAQSKSFIFNLVKRPSSLLEATIVANDVAELKRTPAFEIVEQNAREGVGAGIQSQGVVKSIRALTDSRLLLPRETKTCNIPITTLGQVADMGKYHTKFMKSYGGAFERRGIRRGEIPTYPILWKHNATNERTLIISPDKACDVVDGHEEKANDTWKNTASKLHSNRDFRMTSQSLAMCLTDKKSLGGRAWANVLPRNPAHELPLLLWSNSTLGLMLFWWTGTRQQLGRSCISISRLPDLPVLDPRALDDEQFALAQTIFNKFKNRKFKPANEADRDKTRQALDKAILVDLLKLPAELLESLDLLREQWCAEPSVHGFKGVKRPRSKAKKDIS